MRRERRKQGKSQQAKGIRQTRDSSTEEMEVKLSRVLAKWSPAIHTLCAPVS